MHAIRYVVNGIYIPLEYFIVKDDVLSYSNSRKIIALVRGGPG